MLYLTNESNSARYVLGDEVKRPLIILSLNPSTASDLKPDMTNTKSRRFALLDGFDGYVILNLYPQRSTDPAFLHKRANSRYVAENLACISRVIADVPDPVIWAAWGNLIDTRPYLPRCLKGIVNEISPYAARWIHRGRLTQKGHPRHPSRLGYQTPVYDFDVNAYLRGLESG